MRGYVGRTGIYELLELNADMIKALRLNDVAAFAKAAYACKTYQPLAKSVLALVKEGVTSVNEAIRIVGQLDVTTNNVNHTNHGNNTNNTSH